jgi:hypothetical protein
MTRSCPIESTFLVGMVTGKAMINPHVPRTVPIKPMGRRKTMSAAIADADGFDDDRGLSPAAHAKLFTDAINPSIKKTTISRLTIIHPFFCWPMSQQLGKKGLEKQLTP